MTKAQREGLEPLGQPLPASPALQQAFGRRLERLPADTRTMLVIAAASDSADVTPILRAWELAGLELARLEPAEREGLVDLGDGRFAGGDRRAGHRAEFTGVIKINLSTGEVILEPQHSIEDRLADACAALTA